MEPSVKGSVVKVAVDELRALVEKGRLLEDKLRDRLEPDFADVVLEEPINIAAWYPASLYDALLHIFVDEIHVGEIERLAEGGRHAARKLSDAGFYGQLERRADGSASAALIRLVVSLSRAIYNFTTWELGHFEDTDFEIVITDAAAYPDTFMWRNVGFIEAATSLATGKDWCVTCERTSPARIVFHVKPVPA